jgi:hypothetical protein
MEPRRALLMELVTLPPRVTIVQKGDTVTFAEPDGVVRSYVANGKAEKHQLTNGVVETKTRWKGEVLEMELTVGRITLRRLFAVRDGDPRQLDVTTELPGGRRAPVKAVYDAAAAVER